MAFDLSTATPVGGGFDLGSAKPVQAPPLWEQFPELRGAGNVPAETQASRVGLGHGLDVWAAGLRQAVPDPLRRLVDAANARLGLGAPPSIDPTEQRANKAALAPLERQFPAQMAFAESGPLLAAPTPATMGAVAALKFGTPAERAKEGLTTYAFAKTADLLMRGISDVFSGKKITPEARTMIENKVQPTLGELIGGKAKAAEEKATSVPIVGSKIQGAQQRAREQANVSAYRRALAHVSPEAAAYADTLPAGYEGVAKTHEFLSNGYQDVIGRSAPTQIDDAFQKGVIDAAKDVPASQGQEFMRIVKRDIAQPISDFGGGTMTPEVAKIAESQLGTHATQYKNSGDAAQRELGKAIERVQEELRAAIARSNPDLAPEIQKLNRGWAELKQIEKASGSIGAKEGIFTPAQYRAAIRANDPTRGKTAFAQGKALNQDYATAMDKALSSRVPDAGTAGRVLGPAALIYAARHPLRAGAGLAAASVATLPYSAVGQRAISDVLGGNYAQNALQQEVLRRLGLSGAALLAQSSPVTGLLGTR